MVIYTGAGNKLLWFAGTGRYSGSADSVLLENILVMLILVCWNWKIFWTDSGLLEIIIAASVLLVSHQRTTLIRIFLMQGWSQIICGCFICHFPTSFGISSYGCFRKGNQGVWKNHKHVTMFLQKKPSESGSSNIDGLE